MVPASTLSILVLQCYLHVALCFPIDLRVCIVANDFFSCTVTLQTTIASQQWIHKSQSSAPIQLHR